MTPPPEHNRLSDPAHKCFIPNKCVHTYTGHTKGVNCIKFIPGYGNLLLSCSMDKKIKIWDVYNKRRCQCVGWLGVVCCAHAFVSLSLSLALFLSLCVCVVCVCCVCARVIHRPSNRVRRFPLHLYGRVGDWDYYANTSWCRRNQTTCSNNPRDAFGNSTVGGSAEQCEEQCDALPACNLYSFAASSASCTLLRTCGTPHVAIDPTEFVAFRPGNVERGCTDVAARNFNAFAVYEDGSCV